MTIRSDSLPRHLQVELAALGVVTPRPAQPEPETAPRDAWWKRGEECPH